MDLSDNTHRGLGSVPATSTTVRLYIEVLASVLQILRAFFLATASSSKNRYVKPRYGGTRYVKTRYVKTRKHPQSLFINQLSSSDLNGSTPTVHRTPHISAATWILLQDDAFILFGLQEVAAAPSSDSGESPVSPASTQ